WNKATFHQTIRNPGATHLVFFAKFAPRPRSDENDRTVVCRQIVNRREVITKAGNVSRIAMPDFMHQASARGREQDERPRNVRTRCKLCRTVRDVETGRHVTADFAGAEGVG